MHILLIYQLTTEAQGIQANLKRYIRPKKQNQNQNLFGFFRKFSQRKMCTHGYPRCTRGRRMGRFCSIWSGFLFCGSRLYCWAGSSQFDPFFNLRHFPPLFLAIFGIVQNVQNKIKSNKNIKNMIITSIKQKQNYLKNSSFLVRTNTAHQYFDLPRGK